MTFVPGRLTHDLAGPYPPATRGRIVLWGLLAAFPFGGMTWQVLHYLVALRRLGFDVWYVEDSDRAVYSASTYLVTEDCADNIQYLAEYMAALRLEDRWVFRTPGTDEVCGAAGSVSELRQLYRQADAAINLCGAQEPRPDHREAKRLVYLQTDPVADQVAVARGDCERIQELDGYDFHFTYGENLGAEDCEVPVERYDWQTTRPPVCVDWWESESPPPESAALTTVAKWRHESKDVVWGSATWHWSKDYEFRKFMDVAARATLPVEIAVSSISEGDLASLREHGWRTVPSASVKDPSDYRDYIRDSLGEFTVAKEQYVAPRSGWFSDRSVCYLAAGRPVVMQETAFSRYIPTGEGLFSFETGDEAVAAIDRIASDYPGHSRAATEIAKAYFSGERVVEDMLKGMGIA